MLPIERHNLFRPFAGIVYANMFATTVSLSRLTN